MYTRMHRYLCMELFTACGLDVSLLFESEKVRLTRCIYDYRAGH